MLHKENLDMLRAAGHPQTYMPQVISLREVILINTVMANMDAEYFVSRFKAEKDDYFRDVFSTDKSLSSAQAKALSEKLGGDQELRELVDTVLTDTYYTILLALDGCATLGGMQHTFKIFDEDDNLISDCGDLEEPAYLAFQESTVPPKP